VRLACSIGRSASRPDQWRSAPALPARLFSPASTPSSTDPSPSPPPSTYTPAPPSASSPQVSICHAPALGRTALILHSLCRSYLSFLAGGGADADAVELDLKDSGLTFSWPCSRLREVLGEDCCKAEAPRPCSPDELAVMAKLLEEHVIPEAKIWLSAGLSAFLFLYTSILGFGSYSRSNAVKMLTLPNSTFYRFDCLRLCAGANLGR
jgi:hypothetical protein